MIAPVDVTNIRIETDRLILRPWQESDLADFNEYAKVDGVGQMCGWTPHKSMEESRTILEMFIGEKKTLALELKETGKVIGSIGLEEREETLDVPENYRGREIGYVLSKDYWGRGLMPEAVKAVINYCFRRLDYDYLTCGHFLWNDQSRRVVEKCGFQYIKDIIHQTRFGTQEPTKLYILENVCKHITAPFDVTAHRIETERLVLRPLQEDDLQEYHKIVTTPEIADMSGWLCSPSLEETRKRLQKDISRKETFAVTLKENGAMVGTFSLQARFWEDYPIDHTLHGREFGYDLMKPYWGCGLMPEAVKAVTAYCFETLGFDFVTCGYFLRNARSARVVEKCGFAYLFESSCKMETGVTERIPTYILYRSR